MKFSLCDHYSTICVSIIVLTIFKMPLSIYNKQTRNLAFKIMN